MSQAYFRCKQFLIHQSDCAMKVSTDGLLLGAWAPLETGGPILDIGTGTGLLALMAAQRNPAAQIDALEPEEAAWAQARQNFVQSPWATRLKAIWKPVQQFHPAHSYVHLICNPPYFTHGLVSSRSPRRQARHQTRLSFRELCQAAARLSTESGSLSVIVPAEGWEDFQQEARSQHWHLERHQPIRSLPHKPVYRVLSVWRRLALPVQDLPCLSIESASGCYSPAYAALTKAFYL